MRVFVGCEESGKVSAAFRARGHESYSCDLKPTRGNPDFHFQCDVMDALREDSRWDLIILFPECRAMALSGNHKYGYGKSGEAKRAAAIKWTMELWTLARACAPMLALENPKSVIWQYLAGDLQWVSPSDFGHKVWKPTGILRRNLPALRPTQVVPVTHGVHQINHGRRRENRSETFDGLAEAMASQWG